MEAGTNATKERDCGGTGTNGAAPQTISAAGKGNLTQRAPVSVDYCASKVHAGWLSERDRAYSPFNKPWEQLDYASRRQISRQAVTTLSIAGAPFDDEYELLIPGVVNFIAPQGGRIDQAATEDVVKDVVGSIATGVRGNLIILESQARAWDRVRQVFEKHVGFGYRLSREEPAMETVARWIEGKAKSDPGSIRQQAKAWEQVHAMYRRWCGLDYARAGETGVQTVCRWMEEIASTWLKVNPAGQGEQGRQPDGAQTARQTAMRADQPDDCTCMFCVMRRTLKDAGIPDGAVVRMTFPGNPIRLS